MVNHKKGISNKELEHIDQEIEETSKKLPQGTYLEKIFLVYGKREKISSNTSFKLLLFLTYILLFSSLTLLYFRGETLFFVEASFVLFVLFYITSNMVFFYYGKIVKYKKVLISINILHPIIYIILSNYFIEINTFCIKSFCLSKFGYLFIVLTPLLVLLYLSPNYINSKLFRKNPKIFMDEEGLPIVMKTSARNTEDLKDILENFLFNHIDKINRWIIRYVIKKENEDRNVIDLGNNLSLSIIFKNKYISFFVFRENGRFLVIDDLSRKTQYKIEQIFQKVFKLKAINKRERESNEINELIEKHRILINKEYVLQLMGGMGIDKEFFTNLFAILFFILGVILLTTLPDDSKATDYVLRCWPLVFAFLLQYRKRK